MKYIIKRFILLFIVMVMVFITSGCSRPLVVPGAQERITIWQEREGLIKVYFSTKISADEANEGHIISGTISTDGSLEVSGYNLDSRDSLQKMDNTLLIQVFVDNHDFYKGINIKLTDNTYIEFDLLYDGNYRRDKISMGTFFNIPEQEVFRIDRDYLLLVRDAPFYTKRPVSTLVERFKADRVFTILYFTILVLLGAGIIVFGIRARHAYKK